MGDVQDLDVLVPDVRKVKLGGVEYQLPGDLPMEIFLRINKLADIKNDDGSDNQAAQLQGMLDALVDLFTVEMVEGTDIAPIKQAIEKQLLKRGVRFAMQLINIVYNDEDEGSAAPDDSPPDQGGASNGTTSSTTSPESQTPQAVPAS